MTRKKEHPPAPFKGGTFGNNSPLISLLFPSYGGAGVVGRGMFLFVCHQQTRACDKSPAKKSDDETGCRHCELAKQSRLSRLYLDCFVPRNDGTCSTSLRGTKQSREPDNVRVNDFVIIRPQRLHQTEENDWGLFYSTYYFSLDCFVPRNDVLHVPSLRACEAIQRKNRRHYFSILVTLPFEGGWRMESIFKSDNCLL